jgi:hypothetical protein
MRARLLFLSAPATISLALAEPPSMSTARG